MNGDSTGARRVGVVGLGNIGMGIALSLQRAGFDVAGTARSDKTRERASQEGVRFMASVAELGTWAEILVLSLPTPAAVTAVVEGTGGLLEEVPHARLVIDTTSSDPETSRRAADRLARVGVAFVDAPVSGAPEVARAGQLTAMAGGDAQHFQQAGPVLEAISRVCLHVGPLGAGNLAKLANNLLAASQILVASEVLTAMEALGLEPQTLLSVINASTGRSFITERVYPHWILDGRRDLGFTMGLMRKDVKLAQEQLMRTNQALPVTARVAQVWLESSRALVLDDEDVTCMTDLVTRAAARL